MIASAYERMADALDRLPNAFPRTGSGVELRILERMCTEDEAALAAELTGTPETLDVIADRVERSPSDVRHALFALARRGIVWLAEADRGVRFRLAPFVVGSYEAQVDAMDRELARLVEEYFASGGAEAIMGPQPALHRVVPTTATVKTEEVLPYDDVRTLLEDQRTFHVIECICKLQQEQLDASCPYPKRVCLSFSDRERDPRPGDVTRAEALALLDMTEEVGLVHTVSNVTEDVGYVCNCCGCCCGILRGINEWGIADSVAAANYVALIDPDLCADCGTCIERCQVGAIAGGDGYAVVESARCIGCGLCVSGCPNEVAHLERKPDAEIVHPPSSYAAWEDQRRAARSSAAIGTSGPA